MCLIRFFVFRHIRTRYYYARHAYSCFRLDYTFTLVTKYSVRLYVKFYTRQQKAERFCLLAFYSGSNDLFLLARL